MTDRTFEPPADDANRERPVPPIFGHPMFVVPCAELEPAMARYEQASFVILAIGPADDPRYAVLQGGHDHWPTVLRLDTDAHHQGRRQPYLEVDSDSPLAPTEPTPPVPGVAVRPPDNRTGAGLSEPPRSPVFGGACQRIDDRGEVQPGSAADEGQWVVGRAGMRYRDLLPGRWGGQFIASHIHIERGGPVPDNVHHHLIDVQLIYCHQGWVKVVYQDQGPPFVLRPGDAVLQAPGIRHQVLEASDDLHVIEISSPAEHPTYVEHEIKLPNGTNRGRRYGGQHFVHHQADSATWNHNEERSLRTSSLGLEAATDGRYGAQVLVTDATTQSALDLPLTDGTDFEMVVVLDGDVQWREPSGDEVRLEPGGALAFGDSSDSDLAGAEPVTIKATAGCCLLHLCRYRR